MFKKVFSAVVIAGLTAGAVWAQDIPPEVKALGLQASPKSAVKAVSGRFGVDVDNFVGVTDWNKVEFSSLYLFLGGSVDSKGLQGGFAKKLGESSYLGFYMNGRLFDGSGDNNGADNGDKKDVNGWTAWNNEFALLFGSEALGGIRLDVLMDNLRFESSGENGKDVDPKNKINNSGMLVTSLQWGKAMGAITPKVTLGFKWPEYVMTEPHEGDKTEGWKNAALGLKAEVAAGAISGDYQLTLNFGETEKTDKTKTTTGYWDNTLNLYYGITAPVNEKLQFKIRPQAQFRLAGQENKTTDDGKDSYSTSPKTWFQFSPIVETGVQFQATSRLALYTGVKAKLLTVTSESSSKYQNDGSPEVKDTPSKWSVSPLSLNNFNNNTGNLEFAADFAFTPTMSVNFSFGTSLFNISVPGSAGNSTFIVGNPFTVSSLINGARLVFNFKPGME